MAVPYLLRRLLQTATLQRDSYQLHSDTAVADAVLAISRADAFYTAAVLTGFTTGSGSVTLTGTLSGATVSYTHTFVGNYRIQNTTQEFNTITRIQTSGLTNETSVGTVTVEATSRTGQPKEIKVSRGTVKCRIINARLGEIIEVSGGTALNSAKAQLWPGNVLRNDVLIVDGKSWEVKAVRPIYDRFGTRAFDEAILFAEGQS